MINKVLRRQARKLKPISNYDLDEWMRNEGLDYSDVFPYKRG